jgi:hypothetical protein
MAFYLGHDGRITSQKRAAGEATPTTRQPQEVRPVASRNTLRQTSDAELIDAAERMDAGLRLAVPQMFDDTELLSIDAVPVTVVDDEMIGRAAAKVAHFRSDAVAELKHLDKHAPQRIHAEGLILIAQCDEFLVAVADHFRGDES